VTQSVYGKNWWDDRVDAVTQAVEVVANAAQNAKKEEKKNQPESVSNEWVPPLIG
jgi:acyl-CoA reductase-like NAD-dependent aldehyde dehydrogenase